MTAGITRRNHGRGHSYRIDGRDVPGVTTILGTLAKPALIDWSANATAEYAVDHWDDLVDMTPSKRLSTLQRARFAETRRATKRGTDVHVLAHQLQAGINVTYDDELDGHVQSYLRFLDDWNPTTLLSETVVASRRYRYCGTLDLLATPATGGPVWLFDVKTGGKGIFGETALQLAAYARAETYLDESGEERDMFPVDRIAAIHVREDGYSVRTTDVPIDDLFRTFAHLAAVHRGIGDMRDWFGDDLDVWGVAS